MQSYATFSAQDDLVRPTIFAANPDVPRKLEHTEDFSEKGVLEIRKARHLLMERAMDGVSKFIPNNIRLGDLNTSDTKKNGDSHRRNLAFIFGPNCSGKSTLLKSVALNCILAHLGCHIPAEFAQIPLLDRIMTRTGTEDNLEANASTFSLEMAETAYILRSVEQTKSFQLVLIDELGRGTSTNDGLAIAWAVAESLRTRPHTFTLFATHFHSLEQLGGSKSVYFSAKIDQENHTLIQTYSLRECELDDSVTSDHLSSSATSKNSTISTPIQEVRDYGHLVAAACGFPEDALKEARQASKKLAEAEILSRTRRMRFRVLERDINIMTVKQVRETLSEIQASNH
jgi:DNA mismatch repair ATPase MutS